MKCNICGLQIGEEAYNIRDPFLQHVGNTILNINEENEIDKIKMVMFKEFEGYFDKILSDMIEVRHDKLFVKT